MDAFYAYSYANSGWFVLQGMTLMLFPDGVIMLLSPDYHQPSSLEHYFARSLGGALILLSFVSLVLTGTLPISIPSNNHAQPDSSTSPSDPYAAPTAVLSMLYHAVTSFYTYAKWNEARQSSFVIAAVVSAVIGSMGLWSLLFGSGSRISKRTGADKRTSGWPFVNAEAERKRAAKSF